MSEWFRHSAGDGLEKLNARSQALNLGVPGDERIGGLDVELIAASAHSSSRRSSG